MLRSKNFLTRAALVFSLLVSSSLAAAAQKPSPTTGDIKGRVRVDAGASAAGISVTVRQGEREVAQTTTNAKGEFEVRGLAPGSYGLTFRKPGLQVGRMSDVEVRAGKTVSLKEGLFLPIDEGSIAFIKGSVFDPSGRSVRGAKVELARVMADGSLKKIDSRVSNSTGSFVFRLPPAAARYRLRVKADNAEEATQDVDVDGAEVFTVAVTLTPASK